MSEIADKTIQLHYIDKIHVALKETGDDITRVVISQTLVSLIVIALATGVVASDTEYVLAGLKFHISFPLILTSGAVMVGCLVMAQLGFVQHEDDLRNTILRLYGELGYEDQSMSNALASPLESPNIATIILNLYYSRNPSSLFYKVLHASSRALSFALFLFLPMGAQFVAGYQMIVLYGWQWWVPIPFLVLLICVGYAILYFRRT